MEKDQNINIKDQDIEEKKPINDDQDIEEKKPINDDHDNEDHHSSHQEKEEINEITTEEKIKELEDKISRTFAEMENQRRRFEKEREDAFNYGGFAFAKETLNLIDNLERSKQILESDDALKNTDALKKNFRTL